MAIKRDHNFTYRDIVKFRNRLWRVIDLLGSDRLILRRPVDAPDRRSADFKIENVVTDHAKVVLAEGKKGGAKR